MTGRPANNLLLSAAVAMLLTATIAAQAASLPKPFTADYTFSHDGLQVGEMQRTLSALGDGKYVYESTSRASGMIAWFVKDQLVERSVWKWDGEHIKPLEYLYHHFGGKKERRVELSFDWKTHVVTNTIDNDPWRMQIPDDVLDKLVYQFSIMVDLQDHPKELIYPVADGGQLKTYELAVVGEEKLQTPLGKLATVKLTRVGGAYPITIWCAKEFDYMPVRIEQLRDNGTRLRMLIRKIEWKSS